MKNIRLSAFIITSAFAFSSLSAMNCDENGNCYTDPVGYITLKVNGADAPGQKKITLAGLGLFNPVEFQGVLSGKSGKTLTVSGASFESNQFAPYNNDPAKPKYFVEFISGDYAGLMADIESHNSSTLTLTVDLGDLVFGDETIRIRKHHTLASVFGSDNSAGFKAGNTATSADTLLIYDSSGQVPASYYFSQLVNRWTSSVSPAVNANDQVIYPEQGILITRQETASASIKLVGSVKTTSSLISVDQGRNIISNVYPVAVTLADSGLYTGDSGTGVRAGNTPSTADRVIVFNSEGNPESYFYSTLVNRWTSTVSPAVNANDVLIPAGSAIIIERTTGGFTWPRTLTGI